MQMGIYTVVIIMIIEIKDRAKTRLDELKVNDYEDKALRIRLLNYS